jgi:hypothetical protein
VEQTVQQQPLLEVDRVLVLRRNHVVLKWSNASL